MSWEMKPSASPGPRCRGILPLVFLSSIDTPSGKKGRASYLHDYQASTLLDAQYNGCTGLCIHPSGLFQMAEANSLQSLGKLTCTPPKYTHCCSDFWVLLSACATFSIANEHKLPCLCSTCACSLEMNHGTTASMACLRLFH